MGKYFDFIIAVFVIGLLITTSSLLGFQLYDYYVGTGYVPAPSNTVGDARISVYKYQVCILIEDASISEYFDTNSMIPTFDKGHNGVLVDVFNDNDLSVGDIVSYDDGDHGGILISHRIVEKGIDSKGIYYRVKGDNNLVVDKDKVRLGQIKKKTIAIIY